MTAEKFVVTFPCFFLVREWGGYPDAMQGVNGENGYLLFTDDDLFRRYVAKENPSLPYVRVVANSPRELLDELRQLNAKATTEVTHLFVDPTDTGKKGSSILIAELLNQSPGSAAVDTGNPG